MQPTINKIEPLNSGTQTNYGLDQLVKEFEYWRSNKTKHNQSIPNDLWENIFVLADTHSDATLRALLNITAKQYRDKHEQLRGTTHQTNATASNNEGKAKLCKVSMSSSLPQSKPIAAFNTIVVECCRADGQVLKIQTTNENINTVIKELYVGC